MMKILKLSKSEIYYLIFIFMCFILMAIVIPFNQAPDEQARYLIPQYIFNHSSLPLGTDPEVMIPLWGISYAFSPLLSYIISAIFMLIGSLFSSTESTLLFAARFASIMFSTGTVYFTILIANILFDKISKYIFVLLVSTLPCFVFISSYVNNDALALFSTSIVIYAWLMGMKSDWDKKSTIILTIGLCVCALSYQNAYIFLLTTIMLYACVLGKKIFEKDNLVTFIKKGLIVFSITFIIGGSTYIRNYFIYDGDIRGVILQEKMAEENAINSLKPSVKLSMQEQDVSFPIIFYNMNWMEQTYKSFIGVFGYNNVYLQDFIYTIYSTVFITGLIGCCINLKNKVKSWSFNKKLICSLFAMNVFLAVFINIFYTYTSDFQPQGRYSLVGLLPFMYFITKGIVQVISILQIKYQSIVKVIFVASLLLLQMYILVNTFILYYC